MSKEQPRTRKPKARPTAIVIAVIEERLAMMGDDPHKARLLDLFDELRRSTNGGKEETAE